MGIRCQPAIFRRNREPMIGPRRHECKDFTLPVIYNSRVARKARRTRRASACIAFAARDARDESTARAGSVPVSFRGPRGGRLPSRPASAHSLTRQCRVLSGTSSGWSCSSSIAERRHRQCPSAGGHSKEKIGYFGLFQIVRVSDNRAKRRRAPHGCAFRCGLSDLGSAW
jgi:hypothetical protein